MQTIYCSVTCHLASPHTTEIVISSQKHPSLNSVLSLKKKKNFYQYDSTEEQMMNTEDAFFRQML